MRIKDKKNKKVPIVVMVVVASAIVLGLTAYWQKDNMASWFSSPKDSSEETTNNTQPKDVDNTSNKDEDTRTDPNSTKLNDDATTSTDIGVSIDSFSQADADVIVSAKITGATTGTCIFTFSADKSRPVSRTITTSNGNCTISLSALEFDKVGTWKLTVTFYQKPTEKTEVSKNVAIS